MNTPQRPPDSRPATVADILAALPMEGHTYREPLRTDALRLKLELVNLCAIDQALDASVRSGLARITRKNSYGAPAAYAALTTAGREFYLSVVFGDWDRAVCPLAHQYRVSVPGRGGATTGDTRTVETLFPAVRAFAGSVILARHDAGDQCHPESDRVTLLATTPEPGPEPGCITGFVMVDCDGMSAMSAQDVADMFTHEHYGDGGPDSAQVFYAHLRGECGLRQVTFNPGDREVDDRLYVHVTTLVRIAGGERAGEQVGEIHWTIDGAA